MWIPAVVAKEKQNVALYARLSEPSGTALSGTQGPQCLAIIKADVAFLSLTSISGVYAITTV